MAGSWTSVNKMYAHIYQLCAHTGFTSLQRISGPYYAQDKWAGSLLLPPLWKSGHKLELLGALPGHIAGFFYGAADCLWY